MARDILAEVKAHRLSAGRTAPLEPEFADALIRECEYMREREAHFAKVLGISDGGRYRADWDATLELAREIATLRQQGHISLEVADNSDLAHSVRAADALDGLARLLPKVC